MTENKTTDKSYRDLIIWQEAIKIAKEVYILTDRFPHHEVYGLVNQLKRAAVSVPSNIAEGQARRLPGGFRHFLRIALGSLAEIDTQLVLACELGYVGKLDISGLDSAIIELRKKIYALIKTLPDH